MQKYSDGLSFNLYFEELNQFHKPDTITQATLKNDGPIVAKLLMLADKYISWGFDKMMKWIRKQCLGWNHKRVYRVYRELRLNIRYKPKKRLPTRDPQPLLVPKAINECWSMGFMHDVLRSGRKFKTLNILDDHNREGLAFDIAFSISSTRVTQALDCLIGTIKAPPKA